MIVIVNRNNIPNLKAKIKELSSKKVKVGIIGDAELATIAGANEFGVPGRIPERAFLRITMGKKSTLDDAERFIEGIFDRNQNPDQILDSLGSSLVSSVQDTIESNLQPANAESTIKRKGSAMTLQDTGRMKQAITYKIE